MSSAESSLTGKSDGWDIARHFCSLLTHTISAMQERDGGADREAGVRGRAHAPANLGRAHGAAAGPNGSQPVLAERAGEEAAHGSVI